MSPRERKKSEISLKWDPFKIFVCSNSLWRVSLNLNGQIKKKKKTQQISLLNNNNNNNNNSNNADKLFFSGLGFWGEASRIERCEAHRGWEGEWQHCCSPTSLQSPRGWGISGGEQAVPKCSSQPCLTRELRWKLCYFSKSLWIKVRP